MIDDILRDVRRNIDSYGQQLVVIFPDGPNDSGFAYTIGNAERGLPELLLIGSFQPTLAARRDRPPRRSNATPRRSRCIAPTPTLRARAAISWSRCPMSTHPQAHRRTSV